MSERAGAEYECRELGPPLRRGDVAFLVQAGYHLEDAVKTSAQLEKLGLCGRLVVPAGPVGPLRRFRSTTARLDETLRSAQRSGLEPGRRITADEIIEQASVLVVRNDWGPSRVLVEAARDAGVLTVGWVEGVQDFDDVDTGRIRRPYRTVDRVFSLGEYDRRILARDVPTDIVGSERLWRRWSSPPTSAELPLLANVNFTYGVKSGSRRGWTRDVIRSARGAGLDLRLTRHPADRGWYGRRLEMGGGTDVLLPQTARLVSRFSTAILDALALGVEVVYHNPHGERVTTFSDAAPIVTTTDRAALRLEVARPAREPRLNRTLASDFLHHHVNLDRERPSVLAARLLAETQNG